MMYSPAMRFPRRERGVVLIFTLIILLILTIGAVALMKSMNISMFSAGNLAFRQDLVNQGEQAVQTVMAEFTSPGVYANNPATDANIPAANYSATMLPQNPQGIPLALLASDATFQAAWTAPDIVAANYTAGSTASPGVTMRYIIDRLCAPGTAEAFSATCVQSTAAGTNKDTRDANGLGAPSSTVYRVTVRITGPRNTQVFLQSTFTKPN
jgi:Tfp pilus assembly protein PilX